MDRTDKINDEDLWLISGEFINANLSRDKAWLAKYCTSDVLYRFLVYYVTFRKLIDRVSLRHYCQLFIDHTGCNYAITSLCRAAKRIRDVEAAFKEASDRKDLLEMSNIKSGLFFNKINT